MEDQSRERGRNEHTLGERREVVRLSAEPTASGARIALLTIDNAPLNLFTRDVFVQLIERLETLRADPPRALLIAAEGKVVSGGVDVSVFDGLDPSEGSKLWEELFNGIIHPIEELPCPVVFVAHGLTLTAAFEVALACDIIVAAPAAKFGLVETVVGLTPSMGGPQRLAERAGSGRARELIMTADLYTADVMHAWGVVNIVAADASAQARKLAAKLADGPTQAHRATKRIVAAWRSGGVQHADAMTPDISGELFATEDLKGAVRSFLTEGPGKATYVGS